MRRLAETLDDIAGQAKLYDVTDRAVRGANRRHQTRNFTISALAVLAMACVLGVPSLLDRGGGMGRPENGPGRLDGDPPVLVRLLLDSPTRGSLAGDAAFRGALLDRIVADPDAYGLPGDRERLRVLFAGDLPGNRRLAIVAGATGAPRMINLTGPSGTAAKKLGLANWTDLEEPIARDDWRNDKGTAGYVLLLGPANYDVSVSERPRYLADGTIQREWKPEPAGYVARDITTMGGGMRVRMSRGPTIFYEGDVGSPGTKRTGSIDPNPLHGRGKPAPRAAQTAADALAYSSGLVGPDVQYIVLWSDDYYVEDPNGGGTGMGQIATVMALTPDGGGPYITLATDASPQPNGRTHPTGAGALGDPERALIVMRMPHFTREAPDTLQIVAPPAAVRVELLHGGAVLATAPLTNGVGQLQLPAPIEATVRVVDALGVVVAERAFTDATASSGAEPEVKSR